MNKFFKSKLFITLIVLTIVAGILMALSTVGANSTNPLLNAVGTITSPISNFFTFTGNKIGGFVGDIFRFGEYKAGYLSAEETIKKLEGENRELLNLRQENERLRKLLELKNSKVSGTKIAASVVSVNPSNWFEDVIINKGKSSGISIGDTVISGEGLVGHIGEVGENWSKVITILDGTSSAGCRVPRSGDVAVCEGDAVLADTGECAMNYVSKDATVAVGDSVETSDISSIYPAGILIGKVSAVMPDGQGFYNKATIKTAVDFRKLCEVIVIAAEK